MSRTQFLWSLPKKLNGETSLFFSHSTLYTTTPVNSTTHNFFFCPHYPPEGGIIYQIPPPIYILVSHAAYLACAALFDVCQHLVDTQFGSFIHCRGRVIIDMYWTTFTTGPFIHADADADAGSFIHWSTCGRRKPPFVVPACVSPIVTQRNAVFVFCVRACLEQFFHFHGQNLHALNHGFRRALVQMSYLLGIYDFP